LFLIGWGITIHGIASELYYKGGYQEILRLQGEWIGMSLLMMSFLIEFLPSKKFQNLQILRKLEFITIREHLLKVLAVFVFLIGAWQLDLLTAPAFWHLEYFVETFDEPFLLPFNIPLHKQTAYVLFYGLMFLGFILTVLPGKFINKIAKYFKR